MRKDTIRITSVEDWYDGLISAYCVFRGNRCFLTMQNAGEILPGPAGYPREWYWSPRTYKIVKLQIWDSVKASSRTFLSKVLPGALARKILYSNTTPSWQMYEGYKAIMAFTDDELATTYKDKNSNWGLQ